jgi:hypothetical protein
MGPPVREVVLGVAMASSLSTSGCSGLMASEASASRQEDGGVGPASPTSVQEAGGAGDQPDVSSIPDVYGAQFQGDADQCAAVVCSGAQVCCVVPIPSDTLTEHPDNRCDYNCTAQCMDSCPAISLGPASAVLSSEAGPMHGGAVVLPVDDAGGE